MTQVPIPEDQAEELRQLRLDMARGYAARLLHEGTLRMLAVQAGVDPAEYDSLKVEDGVLVAEKQHIPPNK